MIDIDKADLSLMRYFDFSGLVFMAIFLGSLEYALEEGPRWDWLDDRTIRYAVVAAGIFSTLFFWRVLTYRQPIVELRTFKDRNFALGTFYTFVLGTGLYGATYVIPLFLAEVRGFSAFQIGTTVVVTGITQMCMTPFTAYIARKLDLRVMLGTGFALFAVSMYLTATLTNQASFNELMVPQIMRGIALMFCYLPANLISLSTLGPDRLKNGAGLYNLTRDLGGAIALAAIGTILNNRLHYHWNRLIEDVNPARPVVQRFLSGATERFSTLIPGDPHQAAVKMLAARVQREALVLTFNDVILMMGGLFVVGVILMPLVRNRRSFMAR
jgi:DHA2 family multidrug resistance protein